jgi:hypothetical protein
VKRIVMTVVTIAALAVAGNASAQVSFGLGGGPSFDVNSNVELGTGFNGQVSAELGLPVLPFAVRVDGMINRFELDGGVGDYQVLSGTVNGVFKLSPAVLVPYLIGGVGMYQNKVLFEDADDVSDSTWGVNGGAGIRFGLMGFGAFAEARVHATKDGDTFIAPLTVGFRF